MAPQLELPCDPATFEIIRHRLLSIVDEAVIALENVSGSPITNEGHDMMVSLYRPNGDLMVGGVGYLYHLTSASRAVKHLLETYDSDPGIHEGDVYLLNDPYTAALHPPDMYVISPVHHEGELVAFAANFVHLTDIGAITPGGFSPEATDTFQEGFSTRGLRLVEAGRIRRDVLDTFLNNVRDPGMTALDIKSQLAANHTAAERLRSACGSYGPALIDQVAETLIAQSELKLRRRLSDLPDGTWRARQYLDLPDGVSVVKLAMTKRGDSLVFDLGGTDPQSSVGVNATYWGTWGGLFGGIFPLLAWDIAWNDGVARPISMSAPEGSLVNCRRPAPISISTVGVVKVVSSLAATTISKMLASHPTYRDRATATWKGTHMNLELFGETGDGHYFVTLMTDSFAGAGGARSGRDGIDLGGELSNQVGRWANAESQELNTPIRYVFRRPVRDSGGPGRYRGGVSHEIALVPDGARGGALEVGLFGLGLRIPYSQGLTGGLPGCHVDYVLLRDFANLPPLSLETLESDLRESVQWGRFRLGAEDAIYVRGTGGGGFGDPIEREPGAVARDVANDLVSQQAAEDVYGVVLRDTEVDEVATHERRMAIRLSRLGHPPPRAAGSGSLGSSLSMSETVAIGPVGEACCTRCAWTISAVSSEWKTHAVRNSLPPSASGTYRSSLPGIALMQFVCPGCGTQLDVDLTYGDDGPLVDEVLGATVA